MAKCNLQLQWKRLQYMRNKKLMRGPLEFTVGWESFRNFKKREARALPIVIYSWIGRF